MPSSPLPNETLSAVFEILDPAALATVARVSHRFRSVAERILYASIAIHDALPRAHPVPSRTLSCAAALLARPHLADAVRRLSVRWHTDPGPRTPYLPAVLPALNALNAALRTLRALDHLDLALGLAGAPLDPRTVLAACAFPALRVFALSGLGRGSLSPKRVFPPPPTDADDNDNDTDTDDDAALALARFLAAATPALEQLHLLDCYDPLDLPTHALPRLQLFRGSALAAAAVLPGRPVRLLALVGHESVTDRDLRRIARASAPLRALDLSLMSVTPILLRDISCHLGAAVEVLKVKLALRHTLHFALSGISLLAGLSPVLGAFPALRQLDLSPTSVDGVGRGNALEESALCTTWARACPALRHVVFPSRAEWRHDPRTPGLWVVDPPPPGAGPGAAVAMVWTRF